MKLRFLAAATALGAASVLGASTASALPLSGCTLNIDVTQTCNLYESDPNGSPSEVSSAVSRFDDDNVGYFEIFDPNPVLAPVLSDVVVFSGDTLTFTLYSFDDGGGAPAGFPGFDSIGSLLGSATEDATGFATFGEGFAGGCCDTINVFSPPDATPEPFTLSIFAAGLVGAAAMRRRKKKPA